MNERELITDIRKNSIEFLVQNGIELSEAQAETWYLLEYCFGISKTEYFMKKGQVFQVPPSREEQEACACFCKLLKKRAEHFPLAYLLGEREFMGLTFKVNEAVLIPRQETELLVEEALPFVGGRRVLDVCTGSGCIIISLYKTGKPAFAAGTDLSAAALETAKENAKFHQAEISWFQGDLLEPVKGSYDIIVSNPPYIPSGDIQQLMPEVRDYEPKLALDGATDGLYFYKRLAAEAPKYLTVGGRMFLEIGCSQGSDVTRFLEQSGFQEVTVKKDYSGLERIVTAVWRGKSDV